MRTWALGLLVPLMASAQGVSVTLDPSASAPVEPVVAA